MFVNPKSVLSKDVYVQKLTGVYCMLSLKLCFLVSLLSRDAMANASFNASTLQHSSTGVILRQFGQLLQDALASTNSSILPSSVSILFNGGSGTKDACSPGGALVRRGSTCFGLSGTASDCGTEDGAADTDEPKSIRSS